MADFLGRAREFRGSPRTRSAGWIAFTGPIRKMRKRNKKEMLEELHGRGIEMNILLGSITNILVWFTTELARKLAVDDMDGEWVTLG